MSLMLPEGGEVMRRAACGEVSPAPPAPAPAPAPPATAAPITQIRSENKELLRQQLLSAKQRQSAAPRVKPRARQRNRWKLKFHHQALPQEYLDHYEQSLQRQRPPPARDDKTWAARPEPAMAKPDKKKPQIAPSKVVTYDDLPYMGEMTLNNSKPRRGRKPKKADICHLIYENYGTVVPGQPPPETPGAPPPPPYRDGALTTPKTDLQNKIISSLLERKLSQENKKKLEMSPHSFVSPDDPMPEAPVTIAGPLHSDDEPLNLCIRDLHELKIQIQKKFGNIYSSLPEIKTEIEEDKSEQPNAISVIQRNTNVGASRGGSPDTRLASPAASPLSEPSPAAAVYWPGVYMHPLALQTQLMYYQRLAAGQMPPPEDRSTPSGSVASSSVEDSKNKLVLKEISELLDPKMVKQAEEAKSPDPSKKRASPNPQQGPVKRKRSAIFIPPVPARSSPATPTAEVSICKFKFTGGSKPSLLEKKMLSVDAGGNFRYYSGTGNKGNKGYDYLHKDASSTQPEAPAGPVAVVGGAGAAAAGHEDAGKKKRKSRKSLQREKLEQTFKEKGFLIQTQQLQSAEGATYCKFRQLRKFTRYLFRSWKDYLPGELEAAGGPEQPPGRPAGPSGGLDQPAAADWR